MQRPEHPGTPREAVSTGSGASSAHQTRPPHDLSHYLGPLGGAAFAPLNQDSPSETGVAPRKIILHPLT